MFPNKPLEQTSNLANQAVHSADQAIRSTQHAANNALDSLAGTVHDIGQQAAPLINRASEQASALAQRGMNAVRHGSQNLRDKAQRASDGTVDYIKAEPVKAMLIAAATGAALMALVGLLGRSRPHD